MKSETNRILHSATKLAPSSRFSISIPTLLLWLLILVYTLFFSAYSLQRHATFNTFAADLSYIDQPMWNTLHGRFLERTLGDRQVSRVAEHLEPIILPFALVYYVWDDVRAILIVQTLALALGAWPVYWIAKGQVATHRSPSGNSKYQSALPFVFVIVYLMFPALQAANVADFHADPLVVTPLLLAFWYATQRKYGRMWVWAVVAMLVKETLPTLTFMFGLILFINKGNREPGNRESGNQGSGNQESVHPASSPPDSLIPRFPDFLIPSRLHGLGLMAVSLAWFYVATFLIVAPLARQVYGSDGPIYFASRYAGLGAGLSGLLARPEAALSQLQIPERLGYLAGLFASVGWLALLAPEYLLLGLPVLVANMLSNFPGQYSGEQHYSAPLAPVFIVAAIYGFRRLGDLASRRWRVTLPRGYGVALLVAWLLAWSLGYHYLRGWTPLARDFDWPQRTPHHALLARFAKQIPPDASLSTTPPLHPHLAHREKIYVFPTVADADFVLLDVAGRTDAHPNDIRVAVDALLGSQEFGVVDAADGYVLLARGQGTQGNLQTLPDAFYDFARVKEARPQYPAFVEFDRRLRFLGYDVADDPKWQQSYLRLYWQALGPLNGGLELWPFIFGESGALIEDTSQRPMVVPLWYPPAQWKPGETIVTETLPWDLGPRFSVGLAALQGGPEEGDSATAFGDPARRLPVTDAGPGVTLFHGDTWAQVGAFARNGRHLDSVPGDLPLAPLGATFAEGIQLVKYQISTHPQVPLGDRSPSGNVKYQVTDLPSAISHPQPHITVVLEWQPGASIARDYTVFVHLVAPDGAIIAQSDARPTWVVPWPTDRWWPGQPVLDGHQLVLPSDVSPGLYQVKVGLYYWETLERLPLLNQDMQPVGDYVLLGTVQIGP